MKLSDYVMHFLVQHGVKNIFMLVGGGAMHLDDSAGNTPGLEFICNLHEQASAIAAENYAKATGGLGVALVTSGPGSTNAITGVAGAWLDSTPCLFLSGQVKRVDLKGASGVRQMGVQEVDIVSMVRPITKYAETILDPETVRFHLEKAFHLARSGRPGPVWLDIPLDVQAAQVDGAAMVGFTPPDEQVPERERGVIAAHARRTLEILAGANRPILLAGNGIRLAHAEGEFLELVDRLGIPFMTTWLAIDIVPEDHPLFVGRPGAVAPRGPNFALQNSDCLVTIGTRLDLILTGYSPDRLARGATKVMVDIDQAELDKHRAIVDLPIRADAGDFIRVCLAHEWRGGSDRHGAWIKRCREWKEKYPVVLPEHRRQSGRVSTYYLSEILSEELDEGDSIVSGSSGAGIEVFLLCFKVKQGQRIFHTTALGAMGYGPPASIGACIGRDRKKTVCVDGDGGFQMNAQELETVVRHDLPIKFFVLNNNGYSSIRTSQERYFGRLCGADPSSGMTLPDIRLLGRAYGIRTAQISSQRGLRRKIREILDAPGPALCEVMSIPDEPRMPSIASRQRSDGSMTSSPLEDLWPFMDRDEFRFNMIVPPIED